MLYLILYFFCFLGFDSPIDYKSADIQRFFCYYTVFR